MARVDYNLYKLALTILVTSESRALITELRNELVPKIPVVGSTLAAASSAVETAGHAATAVTESSQIVEALMKLGYSAGSTLAPLFPLYRDAQELDMVVTIDMLARRCAASIRPKLARTDKPFRQNVDDYSDRADLPATTACGHFADGMQLYKDGNGDLANWRGFTHAMSEIYLSDMTPTSDHFVEISSMIVAACEQMFTANGTSQIGKQSQAGSTTCADAVLFSTSAGSKSADLKAAEQTATNLSYRTIATPKASTSGSNPDPKPNVDKSQKPVAGG